MNLLVFDEFHAIKFTFVGFLATTKEEYGEKLHDILSMPVHKRIEMQERARESVLTRFSNESFQKAFVNDLEFALN